MPATNTDTLEVQLVFQTIVCRTCEFFWPAKGGAQPYGPYSTFDFDQNYPAEAVPASGEIISFPWLSGNTSTPGFPNPEIMDGCRKAPIMTIGINPNLTSFFPGPTGASWTYPDFSSANGADASTKYAYYYRYRSIYQEHFDPQFIQPYLLPDGQIVASADGKVGLVKVNGITPPIEMDLEYTGETKPTVVNLTWVIGTAPYVILFNSGSPFKKGDIIAAKLSVPAGKPANIDRQIITYYNQFVPVINYFTQFLQGKGNTGANVRMGEDVCQLDMVACASPHWGPPFLGGSVVKENEVISNCVTSNAWVIKQLVQTRPAVLYLIGESSFDMFRDNLGNLVKGNVALPSAPEDGAFTLLRMTIDPNNPVTLQYSYSDGGNTYNLSTRLVISPHFSFYYNFIPQFRFSPADLKNLETNFADCYAYIKKNPDISPGVKQPGDAFASFLLNKNVPQILSYLQTSYNSAYSFLQGNYYDPHAMLNTVLEQLYNSGNITWIDAAGGNPGYLSRNEGSCNFCVNEHWSFPLGCPYNKNTQAPPPPGLLEQIVADMIAKGKPATAMALRSYAEKLVYAPDGKIII